MVRLNTDLVFVTEVDDQAVLLDGAASLYLTANGTGSVIIGALQSGSSVEALVTRVTEEFEVDPDRARADCESFLDDLEGRGWLLHDGDDQQAPAGR